MIRKPELTRTEFKRKAPAAEPKPAKGPRPKKCAHCREPFVPVRQFETWCGPECGLIISQQRIAKQKAAKAKAERAVDKAKRDGMKRRADYVQEAQAAWNKYVRLRDVGKPCCSCGAMPEQKYGGTMDCSHYRSRGSAPHLKFHLHNAASACVKCNRFLGGNVAALRAGLIERLGLEKILAIESNNEPRKFDQAYLIRIKNIFTKKAKRVQSRLQLHSH